MESVLVRMVRRLPSFSPNKKPEFPHHQLTECTSYEKLYMDIFLLFYKYNCTSNKKK